MWQFYFLYQLGTFVLIAKVCSVIPLFPPKYKTDAYFFTHCRRVQCLIKSKNDFVLFKTVNFHCIDKRELIKLSNNHVDTNCFFWLWGEADPRNEFGWGQVVSIWRTVYFAQRPAGGAGRQILTFFAPTICKLNSIFRRQNKSNRDSSRDFVPRFRRLGNRSLSHFAVDLWQVY